MRLSGFVLYLEPPHGFALDLHASLNFALSLTTLQNWPLMGLCGFVLYLEPPHGLALDLHASLNFVPYLMASHGFALYLMALHGFLQGVLQDFALDLATLHGCVAYPGLSISRSLPSIPEILCLHCIA
jgi:hypothetical protein